jgi:drug/metabolite transporter (DMT)-like permease
VAPEPPARARDRTAGAPRDVASRLPRASERERRIAEGLALLVMVFWAANFIVVKSANREIPPAAFALLRFGIAASVLMVVLRVREGSVSLPGRDAMAVMGLGALGFGLYQLVWSAALQSIPVGDSALLIAATPVLTALLAVVAGSDVLTRTKLAGSLVSFAGVAIVVAAGPGLALASGLAGAPSALLLGDVMTLFAAFCFAIYTAFGSPILRRHSPLKTTAWAMAGGCVVLAGPGLAQAASTSWGAVDLGAWGGLVYSALIPAGLSNVLIFQAIRLLGPTRITNYQFLVPFIAVLLGAAFLSERIRTEQIVGGVVIVLGVALTRAASAAGLGGWVRERLPS